MTSITGTAKSFTNKHQSEKIGTGTDACRTTVVIYHRDTLGKDRKLPANIVVWFTMNQVNQFLQQ